jgi:DNA invertase Pin-like site-specific DNA recombinase
MGAIILLRWEVYSMNEDGKETAGGGVISTPQVPGPGARAALFSRFGALPQKATSLNDQIALVRAFAAPLGWVEVCAEIETGRSGVGTYGRLGLQHVLELAHQGAIDVVLVDKLERLSRDQRELLMLVEELQRCNVVVCTVQNGVVGKDYDPFALMRAMEGLEHQFRRARQRQRTNKTMNVQADAAR